MRKTDSRLGVRLALSVPLALGLVALMQLALELKQREILFISLRWTGIFGMGLLFASLGVVLIALTWSTHWVKVQTKFEIVLLGLSRLRKLNLVLFAFLIIVYSYLILGPQGRYVEGYATRLALFSLLVLAGGIFLKAYNIQTSWERALMSAGLIAAVGYQLSTYIPAISTYPLTLGWSESSRYYYASLYLAERIYGRSVPLSPLHPSRYLMQSIPFLLPSSPLWFHRAWQVFLWIGMPLLTTALLSRRLRTIRNGVEADGNKISWITPGLFLMWGFLFLLIGPVYYHLLVVPVVVYTGFSSDRFLRSLLVVILASAWAGISRVNWFPVAGMLAATLYFLETGLPARPEHAPGKIGGYLLKPIGWILAGLFTAITFQALFVRLSGVEAEAFTSSLTSDLLWYRLLPNPTYSPGILLAIGVVSAPLIILNWKRLRGCHPVRILGLVVILLFLLAGGIVVSVKIGGGSNLHNLDAYLLILFTISSYAMWGRVNSDSMPTGIAKLSFGLVASVMVVPILFTVISGGPNSEPSRGLAYEALDQIRATVNQAAHAGEPVLFITERHLLTFGEITGVSLEDRYETVYLMEMAMGGNKAYLEKYYADLREKHFGLIITDPMKDVLKGKSDSFGEENDVWVRRVVRPTLASYQRKVLFKELGIEILEPKP